MTARWFVAGLWLASMAISGALATLVIGFDAEVAAIWGAAALVVPAAAVLAPSGAQDRHDPSRAVAALPDVVYRPSVFQEDLVEGPAEAAVAAPPATATANGVPSVPGAEPSRARWPLAAGAAMVAGAWLIRRRPRVR